ncbi:hypothetical protein PMIT1320_00853 [Prochlorococcus marinus str. MIT 1320]|nr:hypothetical protein PMIT1320_00853 [Prochlorococcus marinus str. MIT 1320]
MAMVATAWDYAACTVMSSPNGPASAGHERQDTTYSIVIYR